MKLEEPDGPCEQWRSEPDATGATPPSDGERIEFQVTPIVEPWGDGEWKAGVLLSAGDARGELPAKSLSAHVFDSREAALEFAESEYGGLDREAEGG